MKKNVLISVKGTQIGEGNSQSDMELLTEGNFYKKGKNYYISYKESAVTGLEGTTTTLKVSEDQNSVTLMRFGTVNSQFVFEKGKRVVSYYDTPYGAFWIGVFTENLNIMLNDKGGDVSVNYSLDMDNNKIGKNDFRIHVKEAKN